MKTRNAIWIAIAGALCIATSSPVFAVSVSSLFDTDAEGWTYVSMPDYGPYTSILGGPYAAVFEAGEGIGPGSISGTDPDGVTWFFNAPSKFLGDQSSLLGYTLSFDIKISYKSWTDADIALYGNGMSLAVDAGPDPEIGVWTHYSVELDSFAGWKLGALGGPNAHDADIAVVLADLQGLYIRGEYAYGADYTFLDNVKFGPSDDTGVPDTANTLTLLAGSMVFLIGVARKRSSRS